MGSDLADPMHRAGSKRRATQTGCSESGTAGGTRTHKPLRAAEFESALYANSSTAARPSHDIGGESRPMIERLFYGYHRA